MNLQKIINDSLTVFLVLLHDVHEHNAVESQELRQFLTAHCERLRHIAKHANFADDIGCMGRHKVLARKSQSFRLD